MKTSNLKAIWDAPDNTRLMKKQTSVRLATHIGARIAALCDIYPSKTKSQITNDLLAAALDDYEKSLEFVPGRILGEDTNGKLYAEDSGPRVGFIQKANKYLSEFELEIGNNNPVLLDDTWVDYIE